jgi:hypothetical protein
MATAPSCLKTNDIPESVSGYLPQEVRGGVKAVMRAAFRLPEKEGMARDSAHQI